MDRIIDCLSPSTDSNHTLSPGAPVGGTLSTNIVPKQVSQASKTTPAQHEGTVGLEATLRAPQRKPVPGKGFRKSRKGCFNCKRRRVKCSEALPDCHGCRRLGLACDYPALNRPLPHPSCSKLTAVPRINLNLDHLRFFRHFLVEAHPPLPYGVSAVWHDVAALSHEYEFLAHALLGLAAQHLTLFGKTDYSVQALDLRVSSISGLNKALSQPCLTAADGDARYAAIMALTYQSSYMPDAMTDFLTMMRGWMVISTKLIPDLGTSLFHGFTRDSFVSSMKRYVGSHTPATIAIEDFLASLRIIRPLCQDVAERRYLAALESLAFLIQTSPVQAFLEMVPCYALTNKMTEDEFKAFMDPANHTGQVLLSHFLMLDYILETSLLGSTGRHFAFCKQITRAWVIRMGASLPDGFQRYMMWPLGLARGDLGD